MPAAPAVETWMDAFARERVASGRRINSVRFAGVTLFFALHAALGGALGMPAWRGNLGFFAVYWALALALFVVGRWREVAARASGLAVGAVDMPAVFVLMRASLPTSNTPTGVAGFTAGIYVFLVFLGTLGFDRGTVVFVAASAAVWEGLLQRAAGVVPEAVGATAILMALAGVTCALVTRQTGELWRRVRGGVEQRERAEEALRQAEKSYRTLIEGSPDAIAVVRRGVFVYVNVTLVESLGFADASALVGRRYADLVLGEDRAEHQRRLRVAATGSRPRMSEERLVRADGTTVTLECAALRVGFQGEEAVMVVGRDVTERNKLAADLARAREASARVEKLAAVGQLAAGVAHDLRNPLSAARNAFHWLEKRVGGAELAREPRVGQALVLVDRELRACATIIDELLDFSRDKPLARRPTRLDALVADAMSVVRAPGHVTLVNLVASDLPELSIDPDQVRQVLVNLAQNGAESTPPERAGAEVRISAVRDADDVVVSIEDQGAGIPEENLARVFEPLFTTRARGTGLGLAIVATIVKRHGGTIDVTSQVGVGTIFRVRLPIGAPSPLSAAAAG
ncbi:MAG TPA: ATP-binding protein [Byssovorax sp.]